MLVRVLRAFCIRGERQEPESEIDIDDFLAVELIAIGKAERVTGQPVPVSGPMTTDNATQLVQGKASRKGVKNAE